MAQPFQSFRLSPDSYFNGGQFIPDGQIGDPPFYKGRVVIGDEVPPTDRNQILVQGVDLQKAMRLLWYPQDWEVDFDMVDLSYVQDTPGGTFTATFSAEMSGKFIKGDYAYGQAASQKDRSIYSTNKEPSELLQINGQLDARAWSNNGASDITNNNASTIGFSTPFYGTRLEARGLDGTDSASLTVNDSDSNQSGDWTGSMEGSDPFNDGGGVNGLIEIEVLRFYFRSDGTVDILVTIEGSCGTNFDAGYIFTIDSVTGYAGTVLNGSTTANILGQPVTLYFYTPPDSTITYSMSLASCIFDVTPVTDWTY